MLHYLFTFFETMFGLFLVELLSCIFILVLFFLFFDELFYCFWHYRKKPNRKAKNLMHSGKSKIEA